MHYRVFYYFARSQEVISSASAVEMSARAIRERLVPRLQSEDDYLGILDAEDQVLQILREPGGERYWVEIPLDAAKASYGRHMSLGELNELLAALPGRFEQDQIPGLSYRPW
ncbi:hypothetical protein [Thiococcus pfennigii]|jgi:hypothetical protein|uniref:hypothetical protein n=1 Tax=Thiococcus pfennigii TaxID=1057 RepID=UPI001907A7A8|nr:hypothetical protein [Thiococcus pfennigii]MBK1701034.1 hypothetical protein [Thiococcus pfennigii]MBK1730293.1 hypothetical protein [Thiococcus pfennigii]